MQSLARSRLFHLLIGLGGPGLLALGVLDSSYLFVPWGNDLLLVAIVTRHPQIAYMCYLAAMSAVGSLLGVLLIDLTMRPLGERGFARHLSARRMKRVREKVQQNAGRALALASLAPPPFPFTPFVMAAAALQYSRTRLLAVVGCARLLRFLIVGALALRFGRRILKWAQLPVVQGLLIALIVVCIVGSIVSIYEWIRRSRATQQ